MTTEITISTPTVDINSNVEDLIKSQELKVYFNRPIVYHYVDPDYNYYFDKEGIVPKIRSFYKFGGELDFIPYVWHVGIFDFDIRGLDTKSGITGRILITSDLAKRFRIFSSEPRLRFRSSRFIWQPAGCEELIDLAKIYDQLKDNYDVVCQVGNKVQQFLAFVDSVCDEGSYAKILRTEFDETYLGEIRDDFGRVWEVFDCRPRSRICKVLDFVYDYRLDINYSSNYLRISRLGVTVIGLRSYYIYHDRDVIYAIFDFEKYCHLVRDFVHIRVEKFSTDYSLIKFKLKK